MNEYYIFYLFVRKKRARQRQRSVAMDVSAFIHVVPALQDGVCNAPTVRKQKYNATHETKGKIERFNQLINGNASAATTATTVSKDKRGLHKVDVLEQNAYNLAKLWAQVMLLPVCRPLLDEEKPVAAARPLTSVELYEKSIGPSVRMTHTREMRAQVCGDAPDSRIYFPIPPRVPKIGEREPSLTGPGNVLPLALSSVQTPETGTPQATGDLFGVLPNDIDLGDLLAGSSSAAYQAPSLPAPTTTTTTTTTTRPPAVISEPIPARTASSSSSSSSSSEERVLLPSDVSVNTPVLVNNGDIFGGGVGGGL